ncbi:MAG: methyltransferase domain-containing protein [Alphaproteobacteria bacterium]|jgi:NADH dehydrogenase [ubiquinone] 1 alpha subcomplex assembly factor 5|nr:methyltransferase domain-containing protein [Alphaproteobacteria bacterium]MBT4016479.1 methyltransferase domain-containing protein [Alphaproteobacteria bacterium]MBT4966873.1 methyltransferase domain-containing protein [Alphaproteobacteria bacterium]MBT5158817.1 methyltransferase domain-containing protein [Alphaproteobacteria bacterium]MBT5919345.1 methyltransferase domain-containing protein [Alphaproteobacteria bacterium]
MDQQTPFDRALLRQRRNRAATRYGDYDFLTAEVTDRLLDRLDDIKRPFADILNLGCHTGLAGEIMSARADTKFLVQSDLSDRMAGLAQNRNDLLTAILDEEALPFAEESFDLIVSALTLHNVNDLPGALIQANRCLRPDGVFLASMFGGQTLVELKEVLMLAESETAGGVALRVSPFADVKDLGNLLQRAGFALPVADSEIITVRYESPMKLFTDLRGMAESNILNARSRKPLRRDTLMRAASLYTERHGGDDGRVPVTFEIVNLTAWRPDASQPKPAKRGSATHSLADALKVPDKPNR